MGAPAPARAKTCHSLRARLAVLGEILSFQQAIDRALCLAAAHTVVIEGSGKRWSNGAEEEG
jgi:hypothetical protein